MQHVIKKKKKRGLWPKLAIRHGQARFSSENRCCESLILMSESGGLISPWLHHGKPDDAIFMVVATIPMVRMQPGVRRGTLPFDVEELIRQIAKVAEQRTRAL
jgi:hypothetical protein